MGISYNNLWKLMIDKNLKKKFLAETVGLKRSTINRLNHNEHVSTESLMKICHHMQCGIEDVMEFTSDEE